MDTSKWSCKKCGRLTLLKSKSGFRCLSCGNIQQVEGVEWDNDNNENSHTNSVVKEKPRHRTIIIRPKPDEKKHLKEEKINPQKAVEVKREKPKIYPDEVEIHYDEETRRKVEEALIEKTVNENPYYCPYDHITLSKIDVRFADFKDGKRLLVRFFICPKCKKRYTGIRELPDFLIIKLDNCTYTNLRQNHSTKYMNINGKSLMKSSAPSKKTSQKKQPHETDGMKIYAKNFDEEWE